MHGRFEIHPLRMFPDRGFGLPQFAFIEFADPDGLLMSPRGVFGNIAVIENVG